MSRDTPERWFAAKSWTISLELMSSAEPDIPVALVGTWKVTSSGSGKGSGPRVWSCTRSLDWSANYEAVAQVLASLGEAFSAGREGRPYDEAKVAADTKKIIEKEETTERSTFKLHVDRGLPTLVIPVQWGDSEREITIPLPKSPPQKAPWKSSGSADAAAFGPRDRIDFTVQAEPGGVRELILSVDAFIPGDDNARRVPGRGKWGGKWMIDGPPGYNCFITDNRSFSTSPLESARIRSNLDVNLVTGKVEQDHIPGLTVMLDCKRGSVIDEERTDTSRVSFGKPRISDNGRTWKVKYSCAVSDPLVAGAAIIGDVDVDGEVRLEISETWESVKVQFSGKVDAYPAYEMAAKLNDGKFTKVFQLESGPSPLSLIGHPNRKVDSAVTLKAK
jgi:hypothetical protein